MTTTVATAQPARAAFTALTLTAPAYHAAGSSQDLQGFHPKLRAADAEVLPSRDKIVSRSRDIDRNNGVINGGIDRRVDAVVGTNLWLKSKPDFAAMGMSAEWADGWSRTTESLFRIWGNSSRFLCDVERHHQWGGLIQLAYRHFCLDGEAAAALYFLPERGGMFGTAVRIVDPDLISNPDGRQNDEQLRNGVELDDVGAAVAYHVRKAHPTDVGNGFKGMSWTRVPRESPTGRPLFVHAISKRRAAQHRSIGRLAAVMSRIQQQGLADRTELEAQITNAIFGLYASTARGADDMQQSMSPVEDGAGGDVDLARANFYEKSDLTFGGARVAVVAAGDEIKTLESARASTNFVAFQNYILRAIASSLGLSYEQLSNDWSGINYSSARTLLNEIWRGLNADRHLFTQTFCTPIYVAWLEEAVARDLVEVPGGKENFYLFRDALAQCEWVGPGRGSIDPKKEADALEVELRLGLTSQSDEIIARGRDPAAVRWQRKRDAEEDEKYGLTPAPATGNAGGGNDNENPDAADVQERRDAAGAN